MRGLETVIDSCSDWLSDYPKIATGLSVVGGAVFAETFFAVTDSVLGTNTSQNSMLKTMFFASCGGFLAYYKFNGDYILKQIGVNYRNVKKKFKKKKLKIKQDRNLAEKSIDWIVEHSIISSAILTTGTAIISETTGDFQMDAKSLVYRNGVFILAGFFLTRYMVQNFGALAHSSSFSSNWNYLKFNFSKKFGDKEKLLETHKKVLENEQYNALTYEYADLAFEFEKNDLAFEILMSSHERIGLEDFFHSGKGIAILNFKNKVVKYYNKIKKKDAFSDYMALALNFMKIDEKEAAYKVMSKFSEKNAAKEGFALNSKLTEAYFLGKFGDDERFVKVFQRILAMSEGSLEKVGDYKLHSITSNNFSDHTFRIRKEKNVSSLKGEREFNSRLKTNFDAVNDEEKFKIINSPIIVPYNGLVHGVILYESGKTAYVYLNEKLDLDAMKDLARFTARMHGSCPLEDSMPSTYYKNQIRERNKEVEPENSSAWSMILDNLLVITSGYRCLPRVVNTDSHLFNFIISPERYTKIDNELHEPTLAVYEFSKLIEQGGLIPLNEEGDEIRDKVMLEYHNELSNFYKIAHFEEFKFHKLKADVMKALSYYLFSYEVASRTLISDSYLRTAHHSLDKLYGIFKTQGDKNAVSQVQKGIVKLMS
ncbi:hypothetical protein ACFLTH_13670 [Bacteroidota bacterium]